MDSLAASLPRSRRRLAGPTLQQGRGALARDPAGRQAVPPHRQPRCCWHDQHRSAGQSPGDALGNEGEGASHGEDREPLTDGGQPSGGGQARRARGGRRLWVARAVPYGALVLDVMLPGLDGFDVCRRLRGDGIWSPVLMLTARVAVDDRVTGLDAGADDYLAKPFSFEELLARLRALTRRAPVERPAVLEAGELRLDPAAHRAWRGDAERALSAKQFALLELFIRRPGVVLTRTQLLDGAWDIAFEARSNVVDVYVRYLREKIDRPFGRDSIETVRGVGYRLRLDA